MKPGFYNTGYLVDGVKQPKGWHSDPCGQVPYLKIFGWVVSYKAIYDVRMVREHPLTYVSNNGICYRTDRHFQSDGMSNPKATQIFWERLRFLGPIFHDSAYCFGTLWQSEWEVDKNGVLIAWPSFTEKEVTRKQADDLLFEMLENDPFPANAASSYAIWSAVRMSGWASWHAEDFRKRKKVTPPKHKLDLTLPPPAIA